MWVSASQSHTPQPAVILRKRRPSQREGLPTKDLCTPPRIRIPAVVIPSKARDLQSSVPENPGAPHLALFEMWVSEASHTPQPAVILRKRRPSQREGLPTKDLCILTPQTKSNSCHPEQSEGSAVLSTRKPGCPTSRGFRDVGVAKSATSSTHRHPEEAQAFATRRPANEGSLHFPPGKQNPILSSRAKRGICSPQYQKTRVPHISRFSRCGCRRVAHPNVVLFDVRVGTLTVGSMPTRWSSASAQHACAKSRST